MVVAMAGVALAAAVPAAQATPTFSTQVQTTGTPANQRYTYRLTMRAGTREERFELRIGLPCFVAGCRGEPAGWVLSSRGSDLLGPAHGYLQSVTSDYAFGACVRGETSQDTVGATLTLPAGTTSTLVLRYRPLRPWDDTSYRIRFAARGGTLARPVTVLSQEPRRLRRRRGVRMVLDRRPRRHLVRRGSPLLITGRTEPGLAGRTVALRFRHAENNIAIDQARSRPLASVRVDPRGRFRYRWRPFAKGYYEVFATYRGDRIRTRDRSCPLGVGVNGP